MSGLVWEDPPAAAGQGGRDIAWAAEAALLREHPGKWARLPVEGRGVTRSATTLADNIRRGVLAAFRPTGAFEARASKGQVWARYTGDGTGRLS